MISTTQSNRLFRKAKERGLKFRSLKDQSSSINKRIFYNYDLAVEYIETFPMKITPVSYEEQIYLTEIDDEYPS